MKGRSPPPQVSGEDAIQHQPPAGIFGLGPLGDRGSHRQRDPTSTPIPDQLGEMFGRHPVEVETGGGLCLGGLGGLGRSLGG